MPMKRKDKTCEILAEKSKQPSIDISTQVDCALAESFYGLNDNIEAFADADNHEIEKPFLQPHDRTAKESFSFAVLELVLSHWSGQRNDCCGCRTRQCERMEEVSREATTEFPHQAASSRVPVPIFYLFNFQLKKYLAIYDTSVSQGFSSRAPRSFPISTWSPQRERAGLTRGPSTTPLEFTDSLLMRRLTSRGATTSPGATGEARGTKWKGQQR